MLKNGKKLKKGLIYVVKKARKATKHIEEGGRKTIRELKAGRPRSKKFMTKQFIGKI
jgi:hypothetical protein